MKSKNETDLLILVAVLTGFVFGFIIAKGMYDNTPITRADMYEINQAEWYE